LLLSAFSDIVLGWRVRYNFLCPPRYSEDENKYTKRVKASVTLNHKKHADTISCSECHLEWKKEEKKPPQRCNKCHKEKVEEKKAGLKNAYHNICTGYHKTLTDQGKKAGPTVKCAKCHPKGK